MLKQSGIFYLFFVLFTGASSVVFGNNPYQRNISDVARLRTISEASKLSFGELAKHLYSSGHLNQENPLVGPIDIPQAYSTERMELIYRYFTNLSPLNGQLTVSELELTSVWARYLYADYSDFWMHRYDSIEDMRNSFGSHVDKELCLRHLEQLNTRLDQLEKDEFNSTDLNLYRLLDTFGRVTPGRTAANVFWPGMYDDCIKHKIESPTGEAPTRYCLAHLRHNSWPRAARLESSLAFKVGVCLPKACDSQEGGNKFKLIQRLLGFNNRQVDKNHLYLESLYCLPDKDSPIREWSPQSLLILALTGMWLMLVIFATIKYEALKDSAGNQRQNGAPIEDPTAAEGVNRFQSDEHTSPALIETCSGIRRNLCRALSLTNNLKVLFDMSEVTRESKSDILVGENRTRSITVGRLDLRVVDAIKTLLMLGIVDGHTYLLSSRLISNARDLHPSTGAVQMLLTNGFFTISGLLLAYGRFGCTDWIALVGSPIKWFLFGWKRYIRFMPIYLLATCYAKYLSKYLGSGPFWDYGTSIHAERRFCEREDWLGVVTLTRNLRSIAETCIPSDWYLANDFQFYLLAPIFLAALQKSPIIGRAILLLGTLASSVANVMTIYNSARVDARPIVEILPYACRLNTTFGASSYYLPYNRIGPYLCGLLLGYELYSYKQREFSLSGGASDDNGHKQVKNRASWPRWLQYSGFCLTFIAISVTISLLYGNQPKVDPNLAQILSASSAALMAPLFGFVIGFYVVMSATGRGIKWLGVFLSAPFWRSLVRLNLLILLTNFLVLNHVLQQMRQLIYTDYITASAYRFLGIVNCYLVAVVAFLLFGGPIDAILEMMAGSLATPNR